MFNGHMTFQQHASWARANCRALGLADCIHNAPNRNTRADALYAEANALGTKWWASSAGETAIGLLEDGRMALVWSTGGIAEVKS